MGRFLDRKWEMGIGVNAYNRLFGWDLIFHTLPFWIDSHYRNQNSNRSTPSSTLRQLFYHLHTTDTYNTVGP